MGFDVLPGPPLAERARTTMASVSAAVVSCAGSPVPPTAVPIRAGDTGAPVLLPRPESALARHLAANPAMVTVAVPADAPFSALRLTGMTQPGRTGRDSGGGAPASYPVTVQSLEFSGVVPAPVTLAQYEAAAPDPFLHEAPVILRHLERCHMAELTGCVQAHGITDAEYVTPRGLDRFGLELLVFTPAGLTDVRLAFPGGPVTTIADVPASIRAVLTCRCDGDRPAGE